MNEVEKNEVLSQVSYVLQFCQNIVSRLSSSDCSTSPPTPSDKEAHKELIETISEFGDDDDEKNDDNDNDDLWWDASSPPPH